MYRTGLCRVLLACVAIVLPAAGKDYPFHYKTIPAQEVLDFPGGYGASGSLQARKPEGLTREPKAVSRLPLYGQFGSRSNAGYFVFRADESRGKGTGYDQLVIDLNQNGNLADDAVIKPARGVKPRGPTGGVYDRRLFGPFELPAEKRIGPWKPVYFAELSVYTRELTRDDPSRYLGNLRVKAGWYLETTVDLGGAKEKLGLIDGNADFRLGDAWAAETYRSDGELRWFFRPGDSFLQDVNNSGAYEQNVFNSEACPFGSILYRGASAYKVVLTSDYKSIQIEPWTERLAEVTLGPEGERVRTIGLGWEAQPGQWRLIRPGVVNGRVSVPPGNYRLYTCALEANAGGENQIMASAYQRKVTDPLKVEAGKTNKLSCGAPLEIKLSTVLEGPRSSGGSTPAYTLRINGQVTGAGGEVYSTFAHGKDYKSEPPNPTFAVVGEDGKTLHSGNLEFG